MKFENENTDARLRVYLQNERIYEQSSNMNKLCEIIDEDDNGIRHNRKQRMKNAESDRMSGPCLSSHTVNLGDQLQKIDWGYA